jgi:hypothetical protein
VNLTLESAGVQLVGADTLVHVDAVTVAHDSESIKVNIDAFSLRGNDRFIIRPFGARWNIRLPSEMQFSVDSLALDIFPPDINLLVAQISVMDALIARLHEFDIQFAGANLSGNVGIVALKFIDRDDTVGELQIRGLVVSAGLLSDTHRLDLTIASIMGGDLIDVPQEIRFSFLSSPDGRNICLTLPTVSCSLPLRLVTWATALRFPALSIPAPSPADLRIEMQTDPVKFSLGLKEGEPLTFSIGHSSGWVVQRQEAFSFDVDLPKFNLIFLDS